MNEAELLKAIENLLDSKLQEKLEPIQDDILSLKTQTQENTQILRALREHSEVNKAEHDAMQVDIAYIKGELVGLKRSLTTVEMATANNWQDIAALKMAK